MRRLRPALFCGLLLLAVLACGRAAVAASGMPAFTQACVPAAPDYADASNWLALPDNRDRPVDVFWVYPTVLFDQEHWLMDPASKTLREAARHSVTDQAGVFSGQANIYAPAYRQMNIAGLSLSPDRTGKLLAYADDDMTRAFAYYLEHYNQGRPFILAGHSQGSNVLLDYVLRHWGTLGCEQRLVAAYIIGWSITRDDLKANPALAMCENAAQVNCFISYNTVAKGRQQAAPTIRAGAVVTNPLTWTTGDEFAPATRNLGATFFDPDGSTRTYPHFTSAQVEGDGLVVYPEVPSLVETPGGAFPQGVYHRFDYTLFFENLRQNVRNRIDAYLAR